MNIKQILSLSFEDDLVCDWIIKSSRFFAVFNSLVFIIIYCCLYFYFPRNLDSLNFVIKATSFMPILVFIYQYFFSEFPAFINKRDYCISLASIYLIFPLGMLPLIAGMSLTLSTSPIAGLMLSIILYSITAQLTDIVLTTNYQQSQTSPLKRSLTLSSNLLIVGIWMLNFILPFPLPSFVFLLPLIVLSFDKFLPPSPPTPYTSSHNVLYKKTTT